MRANLVCLNGQLCAMTAPDVSKLSVPEYGWPSAPTISPLRHSGGILLTVISPDCEAIGSRIDFRYSWYRDRNLAAGIQPYFYPDFVDERAVGWTPEKPRDLLSTNGRSEISL